MEKRIIQGPPKRPDEAEEEYAERSSLISATILGWLINNGCDTSEKTLSILPKLRAGNPDWHSDLDKDADERYPAIRGGRITQEKDPSSLLAVPISQIIPLAQENTTRSYEELTDHKPFDGLVRQHPNRAVAALTLAARRGKYPLESWISVLQEWPDDARHRLNWLFGARLARLPSEYVVELRHLVLRWLGQQFPKLALQDQTRALSIFDALLAKLFEGGEEATESRISDVRVAGDDQGWSRRTMDYALKMPSVWLHSYS